MTSSQLSQDYLNCPRLASYHPVANSADEMMANTGDIKPLWRSFIKHLCQVSDENLNKSILRGNQYLMDAGVFFRQYGEDLNQERDWPLSHIPVLVSEREWTHICDAICQRANVLEALVADLYGPNNLVKDKILPPHLIASNAEWLRPMVGSKPRGGHFLHFLAFEIGRGPEGNWWVLGDRAQAPSGAGFALENRVATSRVFSDYFETANVHRLAGFFKSFKTALSELSGNPDHIPAILSPGRMTDTYYEHAYIARYLGLSLLEGEDLTVENGDIMVRTVKGPRPLSVLWRRLDSLFSDPLELQENSKLGTPGLVAAARNGTVTLVNALGAGIVETRAFLAFMPRISKALTGEALKMPNIATWWCGQAEEREHVRKNAHKMLLGPAMSTTLPFSIDKTTAIGSTFRMTALDSMDHLLEAEGSQLVGQEAVTLSTTPVLEGGRLTPRPMTIRVFACRTSHGWEIMPGGYARIGKAEDVSAIALQKGGAVADVWVIGEKAVDTPSLISQTKVNIHRNELGNLPSRAADNLFWLGRYAERAEHKMRVQRAYHMRYAEHADPNRPLLKLIEGHLSFLGMSPQMSPIGGIIDTLTSALNASSQLRDRFSDDGWIALKQVQKDALKYQNENLPLGDELARSMNDLIRKVTALSGLIHENMYRFTGWRFLSVGRSIERAMETCSLLTTFIAPNNPSGASDVALEVCDSAMSHRRLYTVATEKESVIDLIALDRLNPRAILFHLSEIQTQVSFLPNSGIHGKQSEVIRATNQMYDFLSAFSAETLGPEDLKTLKDNLSKLSTLISRIYFV